MLSGLLAIRVTLMEFGTWLFNLFNAVYVERYSVFFLVLHNVPTDWNRHYNVINFTKQKLNPLGYCLVGQSWHVAAVTLKLIHHYFSYCCCFWSFADCSLYLLMPSIWYVLLSWPMKRHRLSHSLIALHVWFYDIIFRLVYFLSYCLYSLFCGLVPNQANISDLVYLDELETNFG